MSETFDSRVKSMAQVGDLVPLADRAPTPIACYRENLPRSPFLTQLSRQYESRDEAFQRHEEARADAEKSYGRTARTDASRHLLWV